MDIFFIALLYTGIFLLVFFSCLFVLRLMTIRPMQAVSGAGMIRRMEDRGTHMTHRMRPMVNKKISNKEVQTTMMGNSPPRAGVRFM